MVDGPRLRGSMQPDWRLSCMERIWPFRSQQPTPHPHFLSWTSIYTPSSLLVVLFAVYLTFGNSDSMVTLSMTLPSSSSAIDNASSSSCGKCGVKSNTALESATEPILLEARNRDRIWAAMAERSQVDEGGGAPLTFNCRRQHPTAACSLHLTILRSVGISLCQEVRLKP